MESRYYAAIDLKSFYASVECMERGLDPMTTNLVVADASRTEKTICLAVTPALKAYGIPGRALLFEVVQKVKEVNAQRQRRARGRKLTGESYDANELKASPELALSYITAPPRMALYMEISTKIYNIYLRFVAPEDIHVYSIDEVMIDLTHYLGAYGLSARELTAKMIREVYAETSITATAGIGTNLYLCKIAMDIMAKHAKPDENGVRIAELDEMSYRKLESAGLYTMGDIARCSLHNEDKLYQLFGVNAELLIDHAWGWEPCTMEQIKVYKPETNSVSSGQVLSFPYSFDKAKLIVREMTELLSLDLVDKNLVTDQLTLTIGYDIENLANPEISRSYKGEVTTDHYGRKVPKHAHGTANLDRQTASTMLIMKAVMELYERIVDKKLLVRRITLTANRLVDAAAAHRQAVPEQLDLFTDYAALEQQKAEEEAALEREKRMQQAMLEIKKKYGKNAILKGMNLQEGATTIDRNKQIGGHKA